LQRLLDRTGVLDDQDAIFVIERRQLVAIGGVDRFPPPARQDQRLA
jgi:hypothetical protein